MLFRIVISLAVLGPCSCDVWKEVRISQGVLRGRKESNGPYTFYNIPYATAPTGPDRYKAPLPAPIWSRPRYSIDEQVICFQGKNPFVTEGTMKEDCLIANVFVPDTEQKKLPVMVYVHGGAFELGLGNMMTFNHLIRQKNVIVVTFNYRLSVQGFLCLGTEDVPGNAGMKDQVALLKWVQGNIASFGGDPDNVTILGSSSDSISVSLLMLSKSTEGLFTKVVPESGVSVSSIAIQIDPIENAKNYARMLNFHNVDDFYALEAFYKNNPLESLVIGTFLGIKNISLIFYPCVERSTDKEAFLTDAPINIIRNGNYKKVPVLVGITNMEGFVQMVNFERWKIEMNDKFSDFLPADLQFGSEKEKAEIAQEVKEFYFKGKPVGDETVLDYIEYFGDVYFSYPTLRTVRLQVENGHDQIYLYEYSFVDEQTPVVPHTNVRLAAHCAQSMAIFDEETFVPDESNLTPEYKIMKATMRDIWYNFAVHGKPLMGGLSVMAWPATDASGSPCMSLGREIVLRHSFLKGSASLWDALYQKYYRVPRAPPQPPTEKLY
ncbi:juvenile hormone esterase-like [Trichoplusia ni]|uniref:Juvenile hormone esterase-like n=1 Tax=Trichoplusia ni TaxID=7111 RepID=A0A7E5VDD2_TRINI|nr:juvenile hormone esterase-like [Trichoplusia ni]